MTKIKEVVTIGMASRNSVQGLRVPQNISRNTTQTPPELAEGDSQLEELAHQLRVAESVDSLQQTRSFAEEPQIDLSSPLRTSKAGSQHSSRTHGSWFSPPRRLRRHLTCFLAGPGLMNRVAPCNPLTHLPSGNFEDQPTANSSIAGLPTTISRLQSEPPRILLVGMATNSGTVSDLLHPGMNRYRLDIAVGETVAELIRELPGYFRLSSIIR